MKLYRKLSLSQQLRVLYIGTVGVILSTLFLFYFVSFNILRNKEVRYMSNMLAQVVQKTEDVTTSVELVAETVAKSYAANHLLVETNNIKKIEYKQVLNNLIIELVRSNPNISNILLLNNEGQAYGFSGFDYSLANRLNVKYQIFSLEAYSGNFSDALYLSDDDKTYYACLKPIYDQIGRSATDRVMIGKCIVICNCESLNEACSNTVTTEQSIFAILDSKNQVLVCNREMDSQIEMKLIQAAFSSEQESFSGTFNGERYLISQQSSRIPTKWKVFNAVPYKEINSDLRRFQSFAALYVVVLLVGFFNLISQIITNITKPLTKIVDFVYQEPYYTLHNRLEMNECNEIEALGVGINSMLDRINELNREVFENQSRLYEIELANDKAKLMALQSQINPHFICNTLEIVQGLSYQERNEEIRMATAALAYIMRYSITDNGMVSVEDEIHCIEKYLKIIRLRFSNRFHIEVCVDENIRRCEMPRLLLQPLVENAVSHGLEPRAGKGNLKLMGFLCDNGVIHFECIDDGIGISLEKRQLLQNMFNEEFVKSTEKKQESIGLMNIHQRLRLIYGSPYGLSITSEEGKGTTVCVDFPSNI